MRRFTDYLILLAVLVAMVLLFGMLRDTFWSFATLGNVANRIPALALVATGMTLVMITGGIDLSVGSLLGFCGAVVGVAMVDLQLGLFTALLLSLALGGVLIVLASVFSSGGIFTYLGVPVILQFHQKCAL
jgi:ribose transport system permease protein